MTIEELKAIEKFKNGVNQCLENQKKHNDAHFRIAFQCAIGIIDLHYELAEVEWQHCANEQEADYYKKKT